MTDTHLYFGFAFPFAVRGIASALVLAAASVPAHAAYEPPPSLTKSALALRDRLASTGEQGSFVATSGVDETLDPKGEALPTVAIPAPEPETYALMLAGLGVVGWAARRRRSL